MAYGIGYGVSGYGGTQQIVSPPPPPPPATEFFSGGYGDGYPIKRKPKEVFKAQEVLKTQNEEINQLIEEALSAELRLVPSNVNKLSKKAFKERQNILDRVEFLFCCIEAKRLERQQQQMIFIIKLRAAALLLNG